MLKSTATLLPCLCLLLTACHTAPVTGVRQYHNAYAGVDFTYPAAWRDTRQEHILAAFEGKNDCGISISAMQPVDNETVEQNLAADRQFEHVLDATATFGQRPPWTGSQQPDGSSQTTTIDKHGTRHVEYNTAFLQQGKPFVVSEMLHEGDHDCMSQLSVFESNLRVYSPSSTQ